MRMLDEARSHCDRLLPGLCPALSGIPLQELERPGSPAIELFRKYGGAGLLIPTEHGGAGAGPRDAVRTMAALSSYSPRSARRWRCTASPSPRCGPCRRV